MSIPSHSEASPLQTLVVPDELHGVRGPEALEALFPSLQRSALRQLFRDGRVQRNGMPLKTTQKLKGGDVLIVLDFEPEELPQRQAPRPPRPAVLHEDAACVVIDKPAGIATTPERSGGASIYDSLQEWFGDEDLRIAHRLDKGTSGLLLLAKGADAARAFDELFRERKLDKVYVAIVRGRPPQDDFECRLEIGRTIRGGRVRWGAGKGARDAHTDFVTRERFRRFAFVEARPKTGRMHQIRVHLRSMGLPLVVDPLYGQREFLLSEFKRGYRHRRGHKERALLERLALHAERLGFESPAGGRVEVHSELPKDLNVCLDKLRRFAADDDGGWDS